MENEHYKRNDSILYILVVISICLSVVSIVMQLNLRSKASQAVNFANPREAYCTVLKGLIKDYHTEFHVDLYYENGCELYTGALDGIQEFYWESEY